MIIKGWYSRDNVFWTAFLASRLMYFVRGRWCIDQKGKWPGHGLWISGQSEHSAKSEAGSTWFVAWANEGISQNFATGKLGVSCAHSGTDSLKRTQVIRKRECKTITYHTSASHLPGARHIVWSRQRSGFSGVILTRNLAHTKFRWYVCRFNFSYGRTDTYRPKRTIERFLTNPPILNSLEYLQMFTSLGLTYIIQWKPRITIQQRDSSTTGKFFDIFQLAQNC